MFYLGLFLFLLFFVMTTFNIMKRLHSCLRLVFILRLNMSSISGIYFWLWHHGCWLEKILSRSCSRTDILLSSCDVTNCANCQLRVSGGNSLVTFPLLLWGLFICTFFNRNRTENCTNVTYYSNSKKSCISNNVDMSICYSYREKRVLDSTPPLT